MSLIYLSHALFEGTDGSQTLTDEVSGTVWAVSGSGAIDTAEAFAGSSSVLIPPGTNSWADGTGWDAEGVSIFPCLWDLEGYVKWADAYAAGESFTVSLVSVTAGQDAVDLRLEGDGDLFLEIRGGLGFGTQGFTLSAALISADVWHKFGVSRISNSQFEILWEDDVKFTVDWGSTFDTWKIDILRLENRTAENVWFDNTLLIGCGPQIVDSAEFDFEVEGSIGLEQIAASGGTVFLDRGNPDRCRRVVVVDCDRRIMPKGACRLIVAKPTTLH